MRRGGRLCPPLGSLEFAGDSRKTGAVCRVDVGIAPYGFQAKLIQIRQNPERHAFRIFSVSKNLVEFRPAGRNKMEIHFIRRLCRPEKYISPRKCGICAPKAHKLCAQSRRSPFCQESVSFFDSLKRRLTLSTGAFVVQRLFFNENSQKMHNSRRGFPPKDGTISPKIFAFR